MRAMNLCVSPKMTDRYAVIGNPISHSKSPRIHKMFAEQTGQDISYEAILAPLDGFAETVERLRKEGYKGCNVTVPFKFEAFEFAKPNLANRAKAAQALNTLQFEGDTIFGDNTDGTGLVRDIQQNHNFPLAGRRILLMGAGGAAYGVALPLLSAGANLTVVNRTPSKAQQLSQSFAAHGDITDTTYEELKSSKQQFDMVINATSSGLSDDDPPDLLGTILAENGMAYEMVYSRETKFRRFANDNHMKISDGLGMLVEQAAESFFIWRGVRPETAPVIAALRQQQ